MILRTQIFLTTPLNIVACYSLFHLIFWEKTLMIDLDIFLSSIYHLDYERNLLCAHLKEWTKLRWEIQISISKCQLVTEQLKNRGHSNCLFHLSTGELSKSSLVSCKASATIGLKCRRAQCAVPRRAAYTTTTSLRRRRWRWTAAHCAWSKRLLPPKLCIYTWWCHLGLLSQFSNRP